MANSGLLGIKVPHPSLKLLRQEGMMGGVDACFGRKGQMGDHL